MYFVLLILLNDVIIFIHEYINTNVYQNKKIVVFIWQQSKEMRTLCVALRIKKTCRVNTIFKRVESYQSHKFNLIAYAHPLKILKVKFGFLFNAHFILFARVTNLYFNFFLSARKFFILNFTLLQKIHYSYR